MWCAVGIKVNRASNIEIKTKVWVRVLIRIRYGPHMRRV